MSGPVRVGGCVRKVSATASWVTAPARVFRPRARPLSALSAAWQLKEITRDLYRAKDIDTARDTLALLYAWADSGDVAEMRRFAATPRLASRARRRDRPRLDEVLVAPDLRTDEGTLEVGVDHPGRLWR